MWFFWGLSKQKLWKIKSIKQKGEYVQSVALIYLEGRVKKVMVCIVQNAERLLDSRLWFQTKLGQGMKVWWQCGGL